MRLLELTATEDNMRVFLDEGTPMRQVLQTLQDAAPNDRDALAPTSRAFVAKLLHAFETEAPPDTPPVRHTALQHINALVEPLTGREQDVLRLLMEGASNNEIASTLVISLATAKKHVSSILTKFGVTSRAQAVARARSQQW
jgi:LuxR family maltose regulon positive regulatory protein